MEDGGCGFDRAHPGAGNQWFLCLGRVVDHAPFFPWMYCVSLVILDMLV